MMTVNRRAAVGGAVLVLLGVYLGLGYFFLPGWIGAQAREYCRVHYGRELRLGKLRFNPLLLELEIEDLHLPDAGGSELVHWRRLEIEFQALASLWRRGYVFGHIDIDGPGAELVLRPDGRWNVADLLPPTATPASPPPLRKAPPRLWIDRLAVHDGTVSVTDRSGPVAHVAQFAPLEFTLTGFSTATAGDRYLLRAASPDLGKIEWRGSIEADPLHSAGEFRFTEIALPKLAAWVADRLPVGVTSGTLAFEGHYEVSFVGAEPHLEAEITKLEVGALALRPNGAAADAFTLPRLSVAGLRYSLPGGTAHLDSLVIAGAGATVGLDAALNPDPVTPAVRWSLTPIDVSLRDLSWPVGAPAHLEASVAIDGRGQLAFQGSLDPAARALDLALQARDIDLVSLAPALARSSSLVLESASVGATGRLHYTPAAGVRFDGAVDLGPLRLADRVVKEDLLRWTRVDLTGVSLTQTPLQLKIRDIAMQDPYARLVVAPDGSTNFSDALAAPAASAAPAPAPAPAKAPPATALPIDIAQLRIVAGSMNYADYTFTPHFSTGIVGLNGTITGLSGRPNARARVVLDGMVDRYAPVTIRGEVNYFAARSYTDVDLSFHNVELTGFSPYSGKFAGYRIDRGKLSLDTSYHIAERRLDARHHFVIEQLELGSPVESREAVDLPVKLAVSLLRDRNGIIDLELPVTGSIDDPSFALGKLLWKAAENILTKAVASPFELLGNLVGGGAELQFVEFVPGSSELDAANAAKLAQLREALAARPGLRLEVPLVATPSDARAMADPAGSPASPEQLAALAEARAETVQQILLQGTRLDPERIFVVAGGPSPPDKPSGGAMERIRAPLNLR